MSMELSSHAKDFLLFSYFGITSENIDEKSGKDIAFLCAQIAYLDLNRTLSFSTQYKDCKEDEKEEKRQKAENRKKFRNGMCVTIRDGVFELMNSSLEDYDEKHKNLCEQIQKVSKDCCAMTYGQAQKWINMTIKYMWLLGICKNEFVKLIGVIHVPVDRYIIEAAKKGIGLKDGMKVVGSNDAWSKWEYRDYNKFQTELREALQNTDKKPIEWEGPAWIKIAKDLKK